MRQRARAMPLLPPQAQIDRDAISIGEGDHKTFSKEVSGKKVVDLLFQKVKARCRCRGSRRMGVIVGM